MSVLIKGMEMPSSCDVCPIRLVYLTCGCDREHCMIQEIPSHGRLIDADALILDNRIDTFSAVFGVAEAPTVIEAEDGET